MGVVNTSAIEHCGRAYIVRSVSSSYIIHNVLGCVLNAVFGVTGTFLNSSVVFMFWKSPKLRERIAFFLIMVLSLTDLAATLITHPLFLLNSISEIKGTANCFYRLAYKTSVLILTGQSALTLFIMNIERYSAIVFPFFHRTQVTKRRCMIALTILGFVFTLATISGLCGLNIQAFVTVMSFSICSITCFVYASIYLVARKVLKPNAQVHHTTAVRRHNQQGVSSTDGMKSMAKLLRDLKLAKASLLVISCCLTCFLPHAIVLGISTDQPTSVDEIVETKIWTYTFVTVNSTLNCFIFFWANRNLRKEWTKKIMNK